MKRHVDGAGRGRLLDAWQAPDEKAGEAVGCLATTFTFQAAFFEEQCLARFLGMATDPQEHGAAAYLIEREERLAEVYAGVIIDRHHAQAAERSLRWDALPARVRGAAMHAKITLLAWSECVRLIIASANLTEVAYRKNLEVFGILDFRDGGEPPLAELWKTVDFLHDVLTLTPEGPARERVTDFLLRIRRQTSGWHERRQPRSEPQVAVVFGGRFGDRAESVLRALRDDVWPDASPPRCAWVLSPFFDRETDGASNETAQALRNALARRGEYEITFDVASDVEADGRRRIYAPQSLLRTLTRAAFYAVKAEEEKEQRPLHAKCLWLENERRAVYLIGSSNSTRAGLGVGAEAWNAEANIAYIARDNTSYNALFNTYPPSEAIDDLENVVWEPIFDLDAEPSEVVPQLPSAFADASFTPEAEGGALDLSLAGEPPAYWRAHLADAGDADALYDSERWAAEGKPTRVTIKLSNTRPPSSLAVHWLDGKGAERRALWLVNVSDPGALPPPDELRDLSLGTLLDVLTMARPLYEAVVRALQKSTQQRQREANALKELDPHSRVRTETFLLQRTRRVARALEQLRARLERPVHSREALRWRLRGPVGPLALMRAIEREAEQENRPAGEVAFLFAEIALTLNRVTPSRAPGTLPARVVREELQGVIRELRNASAGRLQAAPPDLRDYVERAFQETLK
jgi:hypothetical protein